MPKRSVTSSPSPAVPAPYNDAAHGIRLQKALAQAGVASRRDAEELVAAGRVRVNGLVIRALPAWVDVSSDRIEVDGQRIPGLSRKSAHRGQRAAGGGSAFTYVMLHKPRRVLTTTRDPDRRRHVLEMVPTQELPGAPRLFPVGRLDADSTGLLLLTNDGELANRLTHPRFGVAKSYLVSVRGRLENEHIQELQQGMVLAGKSTQGRLLRGRRNPAAADGRPTEAHPPVTRHVQIDHVRLVSRQHDRARGDRTLLEVTLHEGHNRVIRRMLARLGLKVLRLQRVAMGPLKLRGLAAGRWRLLHVGEVAALRRAAGL